MTATFDDLAGTMDGALVVVTTAVDGQRGGCLVGFHSQCSIEPPRYAVWLSRANHTYRLALFAEHLAVHVLGDGDEAVARHWGRASDDDTDKFVDVAWTVGTGGVPLLGAVPARLVARKRTVIDDGSDHVCFMVDPVEVHGAPPARPLRVSAVGSLDPGHAATDRPVPELHAGPG